MLRKKRKPTGEIVLQCPNPNCTYSEAYTASSHSKERKKKISSRPKVMVVDDSEKSGYILPKTQVKCPKCGYEEAFFEQCQLKSTCEPSTTFYRCVYCGHRWIDDESLVLIRTSKDTIEKRECKQKG